MAHLQLAYHSQNVSGGCHLTRNDIGVANFRYENDLRGDANLDLDLDAYGWRTNPYISVACL